jgi:voltage-gated potassium channel
MRFFPQAGTAVFLVALSLWVQCAGMAALILWVRRAVTGEGHRIGPFRSASLVVRLTTALIALDGLLILLWASGYRLFCFTSWESAFYFSASSYATVGYGDVVLPPNWRMLGPLESIIGVLTCGVSVSLAFAIITRLIGRETQVPEQR